MPGYSHITYAQLQTEVANRLDDQGNIFWSAAEVQLYILEALRTWQAFAHYWRDRMTFNTPLVTPPIFYDLTQQAGTLIPFTVKDSDIASVMLFHLLEPQLNAGLYVGTDMFTLADFTKAMERRRNQFLLEAGMVLTRSIVNWPAPPISRSPIDDRTIGVVRAAWIDANGSFTVLWRSNEWTASAFKKGWENTVGITPSEYTAAAEPPVSLQVIPPPANNGQVEMLSIFTGAALNPSAGVLLGVPDDFSWAIKWGALADLLVKSGQARDMLRASYCEQRYKEGVALALVHTSAVQGLINGAQATIQAVKSLDTFSPSWQNATPGPPTALALASWNMLAVSPPPDGVGYSVTADVIKNAPLPVNPGDFVQLGREELDAVIDYVEHLAWFKVGGNEFLGTVPLYQNFQRLAAVYNETLKATIAEVEPMGDRAARQDVLEPRRAPAGKGA
jgi:hypothetical protein